ncbi:glycerophosphodiester phosphodiesterase [bacterium]|nr:glycerophosphodiester phosphodiesterase [bacterium]
MGNRFQEVLQGRPVILGHRGSPEKAQENSIQSFLLALEDGADGVELDVHGTSDGELIVFHDENLSDGRYIREHTYPEVKIASQRQKVVVHRLEKVFRALAGKGFINIELKSKGLEAKVLQFARDLLPPDTFLFSSFIPDTVAECRKLAADVPAILIRVEPEALDSELECIRRIEASGVAYHHSQIDDKLAAFFKENKVPLFTWTVNDIEEAKRLEALDISGIITDRPAELMKYFKGVK